MVIASNAQAPDLIAEKMGLNHPTPEAAKLLAAFYEQMMETDSYLMHMQTIVPQVYITIDTLKDLWLDALIGLGFYVGTGGSPESLTVAFVRAVKAFKLLSDDESELIHVILYLSKGLAYTVPVSEELVRASYIDATVSIDDLLDRLVKRGITVQTEGTVQLIF